MEKKKMIFSESLRNAALEEVRAAYRKKQQLKQAHDDTYRKLCDLKEEIEQIGDTINGTVKAFDFELRGVREEGKLIPDPDYDQDYLRDYFLREIDEDEDEYI